jgi:hypothetical protein
MQKRHDDDLERILDDLHDLGFVHIPWPRIYRIYDCERLTTKVWNDLRERWAGRKTGLQVFGQESNGHLFLVTSEMIAALPGDETRELKILPFDGGPSK